MALHHVTDSSCKKDFIVLCYESFMLGWLVYFASKVFYLLLNSEGNKEV